MENGNLPEISDNSRRIKRPRKRTNAKSNIKISKSKARAKKRPRPKNPATVNRSRNAAQSETALLDINQELLAENSFFRQLIQSNPDTILVAYDDLEILRRAIDAAGVGTWEWDIANNLITWNKWHYLLLGLEPEDDFQTYESFIRHVHPDDRESLSHELMNALQEGYEFEFTFRVPLNGGALRWIRSRGRVAQKDASGRPRHMSGVAMDVTAQFRAGQELQQALDEMEFRVQERTFELTALNEQLQDEIAQRQQLEVTRRELMQRLVSSQEDERLRISRELHDQMGQNLVAMMMGLKTLPEAGVPRFVERMSQLQDLTELLMEQVHYLAWQLRPAELDNLGLEAALAHYVKQWQQNNGIGAEFLSNGLKNEKRLPSHVETAFYRAMQEALTNVGKHAKAHHVAVLLEKRGDQIVAVVEDDGIGFDAEIKIIEDAETAFQPAFSTQRLGLIGMRERMALIGGTVEIESGPNKGTSVFLRAPIEG